MTSRTLTDQQVAALEFQTTQLYEAFKRTVEFRGHQDAVWSRELIGALGKSLRIATGCSAWMGLARDTQRAPLFDKYLLHYALCDVPCVFLERITESQLYGHTSTPEETDVTGAALKTAIDNSKKSYHTLGAMVSKLSYAHKFAEIIDALEYVREKYQERLRFL